VLGSGVCAVLLAGLGYAVTLGGLAAVGVLCLLACALLRTEPPRSGRPGIPAPSQLPTGVA
jgi:hypothetical protein